MNKKQDIIQAAARVFEEQGFEGTSTLGIAKEAGVTEPLIYYHFKGREETCSACPAELKYSEQIPTKNIHLRRERPEVNLFIAMIIRVFWQRGLGHDQVNGMRAVTVGFCGRN